MKSIPLALTWEFWRQAGGALFTSVAVLTGLVALVYGGLRLDRLAVRPVEMFASLHICLFLFVVVGLAAVICHSTGSPQYRFALPVSIRTSVLVPMINGAIATVVGYLAIALLANWLFNAQWTLLKPAIISVCMISVCQAVAWMFWSSANLRFAIVAGVAAMLGVVVMYLNGIDSSDPKQLMREWDAIRPLDTFLAIFIPIAACTFSFVVLTLARRGQVFSMTAVGRWLLAKFNIRFGSDTRAATPMAAELWSEWTARGRVMPAGALLFTIILCGFFLSGRFAWRSAWNGIAVCTWLQVMGGAIVGLFLGHVGERFDFHEHLATRPLSDIQLADVKLWNALKSVLWTWMTWIIGVALALACLALVGQGPASWSDVVPPVPVLVVLMIPFASWTLTSLAVSVSILRPWLIKAAPCVLALLPAVPYALMFLIPGHEREIAVSLQWSWIGFVMVGTIALYAVAFRLRLITAKRIAVVCIAYLLPFAAWLALDRYLSLPDVPPLAVGFVLSNGMLPFVCVAAVPLAIWWNRHR